MQRIAMRLPMISKPAIRKSKHGMNVMITEALYQEYFTGLITGDRALCTDIVQKLLNQGIDLKTLYLELFQKSLYEVGSLWETNKITVAREHMATALTEGLLSLVYPLLFKGGQPKQKVIISCTANEHHQLGAKIIADYFEIKGWDSHFLGANTPLDHLLSHIDEVKPDLVGLSLSVYFNMPALKKAIAAVRNAFPHIDMIVGGQAFRWGGEKIVKQYPNTVLTTSLYHLDEIIFKN